MVLPVGLGVVRSFVLYIKEMFFLFCCGSVTSVDF